MIVPDGRRDGGFTAAGKQNRQQTQEQACGSAFGQYALQAARASDPGPGRVRGDAVINARGGQQIKEHEKQKSGRRRMIRTGVERCQPEEEESGGGDEPDAGIAHRSLLSGSVRERVFRQFGVDKGACVARFGEVVEGGLENAVDRAREQGDGGEAEDQHEDA